MHIENWLILHRISKQASKNNRNMGVLILKHLFFFHLKKHPCSGYQISWITCFVNYTIIILFSSFLIKFWDFVYVFRTYLRVLFNLRITSFNSTEDNPYSPSIPSNGSLVCTVISLQVYLYLLLYFLVSKASNTCIKNLRKITL